MLRYRWAMPHPGGGRFLDRGHPPQTRPHLLPQSSLQQSEGQSASDPQGHWGCRRTLRNRHKERLLAEEVSEEPCLCKLLMNACDISFEPFGAAVLDPGAEQT